MRARPSHCPGVSGMETCDPSAMDTDRPFHFHSSANPDVDILNVFKN
jgi:hypothetical protein